MLPAEDLLRWLFAAGPGLRGMPSSETALEAMLDALRAEPIAYCSLGHRDDDLAGNPELYDRLRLRHRHQMARNLELLAVAGEAQAALRARGVDSVLLKGTWLLTHGVYGDLGARYMQDVDILVAPDNRAPVTQALAGLGFSSSGVGGWPKHLPAFERGRVLIEVHEWAYWDARGRAVGLADLRARPAADAELALTVTHLLHHAFVSSPVEAWLVVRLIADYLALEARSAFESSEVLKALGAAGLLPRHRATLELARSLRDGSPLTGPAAHLLRSIAPIEARNPGRASLRYLYALGSSAPWWFLSGTARHLLFPDRRTMEAIYGLVPGSKLAIPLYAVRPVELMMKGLRVAAREIVRGRDT